MALLALAALLGVQAEDTACLLQSHKAQALRTVTCPHGFETYAFSTWPQKLYSKGEGPPEGGISITNYVETSDCLQPAIFNSENGDDTNGNLLDCKCNALVMAGLGSTDESVDVCPQEEEEDAYPSITLTFDNPQTILEVEFFDVGAESAEFSYWTTSGQTKTALANGVEGESAPLDLSGLTDPAPIDIKRIMLLRRSGHSFFLCCLLRSNV